MSVQMHLMQGMETIRLGAGGDGRRFRGKFRTSGDGGELNTLHAPTYPCAMKMVTIRGWYLVACEHDGLVMIPHGAAEYLGATKYFLRLVREANLQVRSSHGA